MPVYKDETAIKNPWYYAFETKDINGKRRTEKKRGFRTKKDAEKAEISVKDAMNKGIYLQPTKTTYGEYLKNWLENRRDIRDSTKSGYEIIIRIHIVPLIGRVPLSEINALTIENFLSKIEEKGLSDSFNRNIFKVINKSLGDAERKQLILRNPASLVSKPKVSKKEMLPWSPEEAKHFLKAIDNHRLKIIFVLAIHCGMRMGEIRALRISSDIDLERGKIHIRNILDSKKKLQAGTKTSSGNRSISISSVVVEEIKRRITKIQEEKVAAGDVYEDNNFLVCTKYGTGLSKKNTHDIWVRLIKNTGIRKIKFHGLRHTSASLMLGLGIHPKVVQERLGHSSISITMDLYSHLAPNMQEDAANALENLLD